MQAKRSVKEAEKEDIVKDVQDAYHKSLKPIGDERRLRFVVSKINDLANTKVLDLHFFGLTIGMHHLCCDHA